MSNPVIVALDVSAPKIALELAAQLAPVTGVCKIGSELFTSAGPEIVRKIRATGAKVFLDLKFHDIPNTVAKAVAAATRQRSRHARRRGSPVTAVDPGSAADPVHADTPDQPLSPDQPR